MSSFVLSLNHKLPRALQRLPAALALQCTTKRMNHNDIVEKALHDINRLEAPELKDFKNIGLERAKRLVAYRNEKGKVLTIEELGNIDGFRPSTIRSIQKEGLIKKKTRSYSHIVTDIVAKNVQYVTGVGIGQNKVYWCLMSRDCEVIGWSNIQLEQNGKYIPEKFVQQVGKALSDIPDSDITVVEAQTYKSLSKDPFLFPRILKNKLTEVVIHSLSRQPSVSLNPNIIKNYFNLSKGFDKQYYSIPLVENLLQEIKGQNRGSSEVERDTDVMSSCPEYTDIVESFVNNQLEHLEPDFKSLKMDGALIEDFQSQKQKDGLANVLLLTFAFLKIEILGRH